MPQEPAQARARRQSAGDDQKSPNTGTVTDFLDVHAEHGRDEAQGNVDEGQSRQLVDLFRLLDGLLRFQYAHCAQ